MRLCSAPNAATASITPFRRSARPRKSTTGSSPAGHPVGNGAVTDADCTWSMSMQLRTTAAGGRAPRPALVRSSIAVEMAIRPADRRICRVSNPLCTATGTRLANGRSRMRSPEIWPARRALVARFVRSGALRGSAAPSAPHSGTNTRSYGRRRNASRTTRARAHCACSRDMRCVGMNPIRRTPCRSNSARRAASEKTIRSTSTPCRTSAGSRAA